MLRKEEKPYKVVLLTVLLGVMVLHPTRTPINTQKSPRTVYPKGRRWALISQFLTPAGQGWIIPGSLDSPTHLDCDCPQDEKNSKALSKAPRHKSGGGGMCAKGKAPQCLSELA